MELSLIYLLGGGGWSRVRLLTLKNHFALARNAKVGKYTIAIGGGGRLYLARYDWLMKKAPYEMKSTPALKSASFIQQLQQTYPSFFTDMIGKTG